MAESEINGISKELCVEEFESNLVNNVILKAIVNFASIWLSL